LAGGVGSPPAPHLIASMVRKERRKRALSGARCRHGELRACLHVKNSVLDTIVAAAGYEGNHLFEQPERRDQEAVSYCPLGETEFLKEIPACPDCCVAPAPYTPVHS